MRAIGIGVNDAAVATRAVLEADIDLVMIAGRYTLLEQPAAEELLPACLENGVRVVDAAVFNSGLLATNTPAADASYNYAAVPAEVLERARGSPPCAPSSASTSLPPRCSSPRGTQRSHPSWSAPRAPKLFART